VARDFVVIDYPTSQSMNFAAPRLFGAKKQLEGNTRPFKLFRHAEIEKEFRAQGFAVNSREGQFFLPMVLHRVLKCRRLSSWLEEKSRNCGLVKRWGSPVIVKAARSRNQPG